MLYFFSPPFSAQDNNLLCSISATERVRLWDKFSQPFDHEAVKMDFFRRVHKKNPPFRIKIPVKSRDTIEIPPMVKYHYENPPPLLPSLRETLRYDIVKRRKCLPSAPEVISKESVAESLVKDLEALKSAKAKFREIQKELGHVEELSSSSSSSSNSSDSENDDAAAAGGEKDEKTDENNTRESEAKVATIRDVGDEEESTEKLAQKSLKRTKRNSISQAQLKEDEIKTEMDTTTTGEEKYEKTTAEQPEEQEHIKMETLNHSTADVVDSDEETKYDPHIDAELQYLDVDLIKKLAYQRLQQLVEDHPEIVVQYQNRTAAKRIRELTQRETLSAVEHTPPVPSEVLSPTDVRRLCIMFTGETSSILAQPNSVNEDIPQLHPALATAAAIVAADEEEQKYTPRLYTEQEKAYEIATRLELKLLRRKIRARAVITPLGDILEDNRWFSNIELHSSFFMRYRSINIGYGDHNMGVDVNLSLIGYCRRVSPKHATIFYDDFTKTFELINYSEYGTEVNGQLYSCDFSEPNPTPAKKLKADDVDLQKKVQAILDKRRGIQRHYYVIDNNAR